DAPCARAPFAGAGPHGRTRLLLHVRNRRRPLAHRRRARAEVLRAAVRAARAPRARAPAVRRGSAGPPGALGGDVPPAAAGSLAGRSAAARRAHGRVAQGARRLIQAEPHGLRMLVVDHGAIVTQAKQLIGDADDAAYSPDGTLVAFARDGDLWLANSDGSGQR